MAKALLLIGVCLIFAVVLVTTTSQAPVDNRPANDPSRYRHYFTSQDPSDAKEVTITHRVRNSTLDLATWNLARAIWQAAQVYRYVDRLQITVLLAKEGWQDKYGQSFKHDLAMGTLKLTRSELEEIRRYITEDAYSLRDAHKLLYGMWLRAQPHGNSLT